MKTNKFYLIFLVAAGSFFISCEQNKYVAECSYYINGKLFTSNGGGVSYNLGYYDTHIYVVYHTMTSYLFDNKYDYAIDSDNYLTFSLGDKTEINKYHLDLQNIDGNTHEFGCMYKTKFYRAISGFVDMELLGSFFDSSKPYEKKVGLKGTFEAVMVEFVDPFFNSSPDTIYITNGKFYYSELSYNAFDFRKL